MTVGEQNASHSHLCSWAIDFEMGQTDSRSNDGKKEAPDGQNNIILRKADFPSVKPLTVRQTTCFFQDRKCTCYTSDILILTASPASYVTGRDLRASQQLHYIYLSPEAL